jgi:hypothetical protein
VKRQRVRFIDGTHDISFNATDTTLERIGAGSGDEIVAQHLTASRLGLEIHLQGQVLTYCPAAQMPCTWRWCDFFDRVAKEAFGGLTHPYGISFSGVFAANIMDRGNAEYRRAIAEHARGRGRPRRLQRWDAVREELYARILERQQRHAESLRDAIWSTARLEPERFRRAFGGAPTKKRLEAAVTYFKRHDVEARQFSPFSPAKQKHTE